MRNLVCAFLILLSCGLAAFGQDHGTPARPATPAQPPPSCARHSETAGGFSICPAPGWTIDRRENEKFSMFFAPTPSVGQFRSNVNFKVESSSLPLSDYATAGINNILSNYQQLGATSTKLISRSNFALDAGLNAMKVVFVSEYKGFVVRSVQYLVDGGRGTKYIITGTTLESIKDLDEPIFDQMARTFRVEIVTVN